MDRSSSEVAQCLHDGLLCYRHWLSTFRSVPGPEQDRQIRWRLDRSLKLAEQLLTDTCHEAEDRLPLPELDSEDLAIVLAACETYREALLLCICASDLTVENPGTREAVDDIQERLQILSEIEARAISASCAAST